MRLLNVHGLEFREFDLAEAPPYVIASHTWVRDNEITYEEFRQGHGHEKTGYQKVIDFASYVKEHVSNVEWLWIDTCCMNQADAEEVTHSVNSMFRWYIHATVCLAYLPDVQNSEYSSGFADSKWFRRGWTLQELLASRALIFLTQHWQIIGHKADSAYRSEDLMLDMGILLNSIVAKITAVPETVLENFYLSRFLSVEERLRWIERRETTKPEDMSYSLMGIFDVKMHTEYGVGKDEARKRLLAQIKQNAATLDKLPATAGAAFNSRENEVVSQCLPNTRVSLLREIDTWASSADSACIFWLGGMAGTGKSTVFKTVAQAFEDQHRLASSFCFKRGEADRGAAQQLIGTVSAQLAQRLPDVSAGVISSLEMDPGIVRKGLKEQFQKLILQPIQRFASPPVYGSAWIICIDALDECDNETDIGIIIDLLARLTELKSANFRLFVTSRPDLPLRLGFSRISKDAHINVRLEDISKDVVARDIAVFLEYRLSEIRSAYTSLNGINAIEQDWPGKDAVQALVQMAQPLFIFAATACRLLGELDEDPKESLRSILEHRLEASQLDRIYQPVLDRLLIGKTKRQQGQIIEDFRDVVGSVIMLAEPLTITALSSILEVSKEKVRTRLQRLHSVLDVPTPGEETCPVRPLHLSFCDYLTDPETRENTQFGVDELERHRTLVSQCIRLLNRHGTLQKDLCRVEMPGTRRMEVTRQRVTELIPAEVSYACRHWVYHLSSCKQSLHDNDPVHQFLQLHFLHWLEALSWLGKISDAISYVSTLQSLVQVDDSAALTAFLEDARRFVLRNRFVIDLAPLQTYSSALVFAPTRSIVREQFNDMIPKWLCLRPTVVPIWSAEVQKLEGHEEPVTAVAFSPDGQTIATGSYDKTVRLWNAATGEEMQRLEGHEDRIEAVAFSSEGQTVASASASKDKVVRLWNSRTGDEIQKLKWHGIWLWAMAFSLDGWIVVSESNDGIIQLWNVTTNKEIQKLEGLDAKVSAVAISPDRQMIVCGLRNGTLRLWNATTGKEIQELARHFKWTSSLAFSLDGQLVLSVHDDGIVRLWNATTGKEMSKLDSGYNAIALAAALSPDGQTIALGCNDKTVWLLDARIDEEIQKLEGDYSDILAVTFSPNGQIVASASEHGIIWLWDATIGKKLQKLEGHTGPVTAVAFSLDGQIVASGSTDETVRLWNACTGEVTQVLEGHDSDVEGVAFSLDGKIIASGSSDRTVRLWDVVTGKEVQKLEGHYSSVWAVAFSPERRFVASGSVDKTVRLWDTAMGKEIQKLEGHKEAVTAVTFSPDGRIVTSGSANETVRLWNTCTGEEIHHIRNVGDVSWLAFDESGTSLTMSAGTFDVRAYVPFTNVPRRLRIPSPVAIRDQWILCQDQEMLWLPHEYRGICSAVHGDTLVLGQASGAVSFFGVKTD